LRTSRSSSTSRAGTGILRRFLGLVWVGHPGPSVLNGLAAGAIAAVAGAAPAEAVRLGVAMTALQLAIGATNDLVDAERDATAGRQKPIPLGLVDVRSARLLAAGSGLGGLVLAASVNPAVGGLAAVGLGLGLAYDLWLRSLGLGWLAFVLGLPLVPIYGWLGGAGVLPTPILGLAAAAVPAGLGLAVGNGLRDAAADQVGGVPTIALRLGRFGPAVAAAAHAVALGILLGGLASWGGDGVGLAMLGIGVALLAVGLLLPAAGRAWEVQAVGLAVVAVGWLASLREVGAL
jgi:protoheme IX farnesyltransferase